MNQLTSPREIGYQGEILAAEYLQGQGYELLERNFTVKGGEIDIIARDSEYLSFVEVKYYAKDNYGAMVKKIDRSKKRRLAYAAKLYLLKNNYREVFCRFDVLTILKQTNGHCQVNLIKDAFWPEPVGHHSW